MNTSQLLLPELDRESAATRALLERLPDEHLAWKPHPKSMTLGRLASHLAELPGWGAGTFLASEMDLAPPGQPPQQSANLSSREAILTLFDRNVAMFRSALAAAPEDSFPATWTLKRGGQVMFSMPRLAVLRGVVLNHLIHHRGQLTVYLRLKDVPLPATYGPSADVLGAFAPA